MNRLEAFLFLTRCLAAGENQALADDITAGGVSWERVVEIASEYWMTPALYRELAEKRLLSLLPADLLNYLETIHQLNGERNRGLAEHAGELAGLLNQVSVEPLLLKGAGNLVSGLYPDPAVRIMDDIDILVPEERALECWRLLTSSGYRTAAVNAHLDVAAMGNEGWPDLRHQGRTGVVELHRLVEWPPILASPELYRDRSSLALRGARVGILNPSSRMIVALAHSYVQHQCGMLATTPFRDLYDAHLLMRQASGEIAWQRVIDAFERAGRMDALRAACMVWERLLGQPPPRGVGPPRWPGLYWRRCLLSIQRPWIPHIHDHLVRNSHLLRTSLSMTPEGKRIRRERLRPVMLLRKAKTALRIYTGGPPEGTWR